MSTKIVISEPVWPFQGAMMALTVRADGVEYSDPDSELPVVPWDKVADVEYLAEEFRGLRVYEFQALIKGMSKAHAMRGLV